MFGLIKEIFIGLLTSIVNASNHAKLVSLSNQKCTTQPTLINLHPNESTQGLFCYPFAVNLDKRNRRLKSKRFQHDSSNKWIENINKTCQSNVNVNLKAKNVIQIKSGITINIDVSSKIWKNIMCAKKIIFGILLHVVAKMANI